MFYTLHYIIDLFHICTIQWNIMKGGRRKDEQLLLAYMDSEA